MWLINLALRFSSYQQLVEAEDTKVILYLLVPEKKKIQKPSSAFNLSDHFKQLFNCHLPASPLLSLKDFHSRLCAASAPDSQMAFFAS